MARSLTIPDGAAINVGSGPSVGQNPLPQDGTLYDILYALRLPPLKTENKQESVVAAHDPENPPASDTRRVVLHDFRVPGEGAPAGRT
jgi:hypothetical protein